MGNVIATYSGGYQQHIYMGSSSEGQIWGNDRESMTYDNAGTPYGIMQRTTQNRTLSQSKVSRAFWTFLHQHCVH